MSRCERFEQEGIPRLEQGQSLDDDSHFDQCEDCEAARTSYRRLQNEIAALDAPDPPSKWQEGVWAAIEKRQSSRRRTTWLIVSASGLAAAVAVATFVLPPAFQHRTPPTLLAEVQKSGGPLQRAESLDGSSAVLGSRLVLTATTGDARYAELRVYRNDDQLVLQASRAVSSVAAGDVLRATLLLDAVGRYQAVLVMSSRPLPVPSGTPDDDSAAARQAGARIMLSSPISVR